MVDNRDAMHKRGWTYFTVEGRLRGEPVSGTGCLPFVYAAGGAERAWLTMQVGGCEIAGDARGLCVRDAAGKVVQSWSDAAGGIFAGLGRPWAGLHTIDTIRRDAAMRRVRFETRVNGREATVTLDCGDVTMEYTVDMLDDLVEKIVFAADDGAEVGSLEFSYAEDADGAAGQRSAGYPASGAEKDEMAGVLWLVKLAEGRFGM